MNVVLLAIAAIASLTENKNVKASLFAETLPIGSRLKVYPERRLHNARRTSRYRSSKAGIGLLVNGRADIGQRTCCTGVGVDLDQTVCQSTVQIAEVRVIENIVHLPP